MGFASLYPSYTNTALTAFRNPEEIRRLEAGAADQRAVDVGYRHQLLRVRRLDRSAVQDPHPAAFRAEPLAQRFADEAVHLLDILRRPRQPGADRPGRLIGHHQIRRSGPVRQRTRELRAAHIERLPGVALLLGLADADDRRQPGPPHRLRLLPDH